MLPRPLLGFSLALLLLCSLWAAPAVSKKIVIGNDLDDVVDSEEDDAWKEWGKTKPAEEAPTDEDLDTPDASEIAKVLQGGPPIGFIKLRYNPDRTMVRFRVTRKNLLCHMIRPLVICDDCKVGITIRR